MEYLFLGHMWTAKTPIRLRTAQSDWSLRFPLTKSLNTVEHIENGDIEEIYGIF